MPLFVGRGGLFINTFVKIQREDGVDAVVALRGCMEIIQLVYRKECATFATYVCPES